MDQHEALHPSADALSQRERLELLSDHRTNVQLRSETPEALRKRTYTFPGSAARNKTSIRYKNEHIVHSELKMYKATAILSSHMHFRVS